MDMVEIKRERGWKVCGSVNKFIH